MHMPIFKMTKFVKCEWRLKCNLYTPKCTYEHLKLKNFLRGNTPDPPCGRGTPLPQHGLRPCMGRSATDRPYAKLSPHVLKRSDATVRSACETYSNPYSANNVDLTKANCTSLHGTELWDQTGPRLYCINLYYQTAIAFAKHNPALEPTPWAI